MFELIIAISIMTILTVIAVGSFSQSVGPKALESQTAIVLSLIEQARNTTLSAKNASVYGVHFETSKAVLFAGATYSSTSVSNIVEPMHPKVQISNIALLGGGNDIVFNRLTGETAQSGTITLSLVASSTQAKTITVFGTGLSQSN